LTGKSNLSNVSLTLLSITQAAKELKVGKNRVYSLIDTNQIQIIKLNEKTVRIPLSELQNWVQRELKYGQRNISPNTTTKRTFGFDVQSVMKKIIRGGKIHEQKES